MTGSDADRIAADLLVVARRGVMRMYAPNMPALDISALDEVLDVVAPIDVNASSDDRRDRLRQTLNAAVSQVSDEPLYGGATSARSIAQALYEATDGDEYAIDGRYYDSRIRLIRDRGSIPDTVRMDRLTRRARINLAQVLIRWQLRVASVTHDQDDEHPRYVPRPALEESILEDLNAGVLLTILSGDAGTGKSSLALALCEKLAPNNFQVIDASDRDVACASIAEFITDLDGTTVHGEYGHVARQLAIRLSQIERTGMLLVIDNVSSERQLRLMLPNRPGIRLKVQVIVTSRSKLLLAEQDVAQHVVGNVTTAEGSQIVHAWQPDLSEPEATALCNDLDGRPLALVHACSLYSAMRPRTFVEFRESLQRDFAALTDTLHDDHKLTTIYRKLLHELRSDDGSKNPLRLLELMMFLGYHTPESVIRRSWQGGSGGLDSVRDAIDRHVVAEAANYLENIGLVTIQKSDAARVLRMHKLTHELLNSLWSESYSDSFDSFLQSYVAFIDESGWEVGDRLDFSCDLVHFAHPVRDYLSKHDLNVECLSIPMLDAWCKVLAHSLEWFRQRTAFDLSRMNTALLEVLRLRRDQGRQSSEWAAAWTAGVAAGIFVESYLTDEVAGPEDSGKCVLPRETLGFDLFAGEELLVGRASLAPFIRWESRHARVRSNETGSDWNRLRYLLFEADEAATAGRWDLSSEALSEAWQLGREVDGFDEEFACGVSRRGIRVGIWSGNAAGIASWLQRGRESVSVAAQSAWHMREKWRLVLAAKAAEFYTITTRLPGRPAYIVAYFTKELCEFYEDESHSFAGMRFQGQLFDRMARADAARVHGFLLPCSADADADYFHFGTGEQHSANRIDPICLLWSLIQIKLTISHYVVHVGHKKAGPSPSVTIEPALTTIRQLLSIDVGREDPDPCFSAYQRADIALTGLALAKYWAESTPLESILRLEATQLVEQIGRPDRLLTAEKVGSGELEFAWLFAP